MTRRSRSAPAHASHASTHRSRAAPLAAAAATTAALLVVAAPRDAAAQSVVHRLGFHAELGAGSMVTDYQMRQLGLGLLFEGTLRASVRVAGPVGAQLSVGQWLYPSRNTVGGVLSVMGGARFEPAIGSIGRLALDANAGVGFTGPKARFAFDVGLGFEFALSRSLGVGPFVRYQHVVAAGSDVPNDAQSIAAGVFVSFRIPEPAPTPLDGDADGVLDADDACPAEPQGDRPDPARRGCPLRDQDGDGVFDNEDQCPSAPQGEHPDPARRGCAMGDQDGDRVLDNDDQCVSEPQGEHPDPARRGCPLRDADGDTVFDNDDQCPTTPRGEHPDPDRAGCPDGDDDNDTVLNHQDPCRTQHQGGTPDPARPGCPAPDRDGDSVPDATDHCPDRPGAPNADPNRNGCPGLVVVGGGQIRINRPVFFATNRDTILPASFPVLHAVADALAAAPYIRRVSIEGHTDDVGADEANLELSQRRANSVMAWLASHGIAVERLEAHGFGETRPMRPLLQNTSPLLRNAMRAQNRRVEFRIVDPAQPAAQQPGAQQPAQPAARPAAP